ncbi:MAG: Asp23/Gls24 family envelope stress response protein [Anaerolineae bacterium]|nr:Asp23/Gls24 family envelope stress response protein [Anaerolineae bacterium]
MVAEKKTGRIEISPNAIAAVAGEAVLRCYGVVGMANKNLIDGLADLLQPDKWHRGIDVQVRDGQVIVDLYVIVQYGTRISEVAHGVMNSVKYTLEQTLGLPVAEVNVHVQGLRMPNGDK